MHDFILNGCDTDSIMFSKKDGSPFSPEEQEKLLEELNALFPEHIKWEHDGIYSKVVYLRAKNYIMKDSFGNITYKGSSLKSSTLEPAVKTFINEVIDYLLNTDIINNDDIVAIYHKHVIASHSVVDIKPWCSRKTITKSTLTSPRENEDIIRRALVGSEYVEGDKVLMFYTPDKELCLFENFKGKYDKTKPLLKLYNATARFDNILDRSIFLNYNLRGNRHHLDLILGNINKEQFVERTTKKGKKKEITTN